MVSGTIQDSAKNKGDAMLRKACAGYLALMMSCSVAFARVDSMDIGDNTMNWRSFVTDEPAVAFAQSKGRLWYATASGAGYYSVKTNAKQVLTSIAGLPTQGITSMAADSRGGVWIGTPQGAAYTGDGQSFKAYTKKDGLADDAVTVIHAARDGSVWIGSPKGVAVYRNGSLTVYSTAQGMCGNDVRDIASNKQGTVFVATNGGVAVYKAGQWSRHDQSTGLSSNDVRAVAWDGRKEHLWVAVGESDINSFNGKKWEDFMDVQEGVACIMVDTQSRVWVGSGDGIIKYNGFEWVYDPAKMPFPAAMCSSMHRDSGGNLWFAIDTGVMRLQNPYPY
ncbi:MAG: hypothetical protein GF418_00375 [Chitinivibrionales bacterium]|nr:hypothetical protein [Chitinivibrionales bacterium]MBD3394055.1 hypothetical protein [Chitinivibrionales bacterium]